MHNKTSTISDKLFLAPEKFPSCCNVTVAIRRK